jgi:predicted kinase
MGEFQTRSHPTALIVIGGSYGSGKTGVATQLSCELRISRLDPDVPGGAIKSSKSRCPFN